MFSPLDDRYQETLKPLRPYVGERSFMKYRLKVEIDYFCWIGKDKISDPVKTFLKDLLEKFDEAEFLEIKKIEKKTKHDVKAVEYFLREKLKPFSLDSKITELIHFGLTSQDINTSAIALQISDLLRILYLKQIKFLKALEKLATDHMNLPLLARTHGQPAVPTTLGKELMVYVKRLEYQFKFMDSKNGIPTKFGGAVGNLNAHYLTDPQKDWHKDFDNFIADMSNGLLSRVRSTTQILPYDYWNWIFDYLKNTHLVLEDFCQDIWLYISLDYFTQEVSADQVGSSAMPQKINPIDFENAEGNSQLVEMWASFLSRKLPVSRLQRDLTDSTVLRNIYQPFGYSYLALDSLLKGLSKLSVNKDKIIKDLEDHPTILSEAFQIILRQAGIKDAYNILRKLTQGHPELSLQNIKDQLLVYLPNLDDKVKEKIKNLTYSNYLGSI